MSKVETFWACTQDRDIATGKALQPILDQQGTSHCTSLGPSIQLPDSFYAAASALNKPIYAWVVDDVTTVQRALTFRLDAVISNIPLTLQAVLAMWKAAC